MGSATLHRHFPTRKNLLETVYFDHVEELCNAAESLQSCHAMVAAAGTALLQCAVDSGAVRPDSDIRDLLALVNAVACADSGHGRTPGDGNRLLTLALTGIMAAGEPPRSRSG